MVGVEKNAEKVAALAAGYSYVEDVTDDRVQPLVSSGRLEVTESYAVLKEADAVVICLPTPLTEYREPETYPC